MRIECNPIEVNTDLLAYYASPNPHDRFARIWYWIGRAMQMDAQYMVVRGKP